MTEFIAQLLWVAIGNYYEEVWPRPIAHLEPLIAAQDDLESVWSGS